jgi:hypothetical protein
MNNILFRDNNSPNNEAIKFENANAGDLSNEVLNHNLYYSNNASTALLRFSSGTVLWNSSPGNWEGKGRYGDPKFSTADSYQLDYNSAAKNGGKGILLHGVVTDISAVNPRPYWNYDFDIGAFEIEDTQFKIGVIGVPDGTSILHSVQLFDTLWERNTSGSWSLSTDQNLSDASFSTTGNSDTANINSLKGFQYKWLDRPPYVTGTRIGTGLYKVSNNSSTAHFYIDLRDAVHGYSLNVHILYRSDLGRYYCYKNGSWDNYIPSGSVVRIWEINDGNTHTNNLPSYWQKALIPLVKNNRPYLVWGPNNNMESVSSYQVYRKNGGLPLELILSVSPDTMEYQDVIALNTPPFPGHTLYYFVTATGGWISSNSDTVYYEAQGKDPGKAAGKFSPIIAYGMEQNYPNPFNPLTKVSFSIENEELVTIKVYDILGREVKTLINQVLLPGNHQVNFNGDNLSSGIYIYRLTSGNFSAIKKMQLLK